MLITGVVIVRAFDKQQQIMHGLNLCVEPVLSHVHLILITGVVIVRAFDKQQQMMYGLICVFWHNPRMCGYLKDMIYALAASNCNMGAKAADI